VRSIDRSTLKGAPLWQLVSFREDIPEKVQGAVEAALEASGLLDAWVSADGSLTVGDRSLDPEWALRTATVSVNVVLQPEPGYGVEQAKIERILASISYGEDLGSYEMAVTTSGRWRVASMTGQWSKDSATFIGVEARKHGRDLRIAELTAEIDIWLEDRTEIITKIGEVKQQLHAVVLQEKAQPDMRAVTAARRSWEQARQQSAVRSDALVRTSQRAKGYENRLTQAHDRLISVAQQHNVPVSQEGLAALDGALLGYGTVLNKWWDAYSDCHYAIDVVVDKTEQAAQAALLVEQREEEFVEIKAKLTAMVTKVEAIEGTIGVENDQVLTRLSSARKNLTRIDKYIRDIDGKLMELAQEKGKCDHQRVVDEQARVTALAEHDEAAYTFTHLALTMLGEDAGISVAGQETVLVARKVAERWPTLAHDKRDIADAHNRLAETMHECRQTLVDRAEIELTPDGSVMVFSASMDGLHVSAAGLLDALAVEREHVRDGISEAESELFDHALIGDARRQLARAMREAHDLIDTVNASLEKVRTASDVSVQLHWQIDPNLPAGTHVARDLLLKDQAELTDDEHATIHEFFSDRIEAAKSANTSTTLAHQLAEVFDYASWHRFVVRVDRGAGWQELTKKLHDVLSGGERAIAVHLPLFAAVAAHYQSAPAAPRLILLDEVFVGVDASNRGRVFGLLTDLDLDLLLTSDHEWGMYPEIPGIAVHQLITGDGDDAITSTRFTWNGGELLANDG
jgi:uncharacterized protein (TIGR02680 family)